MPHKIRIALAAMSLAIALPALAQSERCDAKRSSLENEIAYAKAHGNANRVAGLETALEQVKAHCTDAALDARSEKKVRAAQQKVDERQRDLDKAKADGKSDKKIAERQRKLDAAHEELERAQLDAAK